MHVADLAFGPFCRIIVADVEARDTLRAARKVVMRRSFIGKRKRERPSPFANVDVHLLEARLGSRHHAVTNVDPIGVIEHFTFADVAHEAGRWAHLLRVNGLQPGDRVLVLAGREWAWRCALLGVLRAGGVAVPCSASLPLEEIRAIAASAEAGHLISIPPRPDLAEAEGLSVLDPDGVDAIDASTALREPAHESLRDDVALIHYAHRAAGLRGAMHTHASLIAQADAGRHWLGVGEDEPVWCTAANGSPESIWLLLAGWHAGANIVNVELDLDPEDLLELLGRLGTAAVWFSDEEYERLASAAPAAWINGSINRALLSDERSSGATAFANAVGANVAAVFGLAELGVVAGRPAGTEGEDTTVTAWPVPGIELAVVDEQGTRLPAGLVGDVVVRGEAPSLVVGYAGSGDRVPQRDGWLRFGWRGALAADGALRVSSRSPAELEPVEAGAEERRRREEEEARELAAAAAAAAAAEAESAQREAAAAEERRRAEERQREEERRRAEEEQRREEERRRQEEEARRRAEQEARERDQAEAAARAEREAEERRRAEEEAKRRAEQEAREREQAEAAARAEREAEERRRAEEEQRREEERRRQEEEAGRRAEQEAREREQAEAAAVAEREATAAAERRRAHAAQKERGRDADGDGQVGDVALLGAAIVSETSGSSTGAVAAPADRTYAAASTEVGAGVVEAKPDAAEPAWRHPGVRAWQLLAVVSLLVVGALLAAYFLTRPHHSAATRTETVPTASGATLAQVPDVVNQEEESALAKLSAAGFKSRVKPVAVPASAAASVVIHESPAAGTKARKGSAITLEVSVSKAKTTPRATGVFAPNLVGLEKTVAQGYLTAAGLRARISYVASLAAAGQVVTQSPTGGTKVRKGSAITLRVSGSRAKTTTLAKGVIVPSVVGLENTVAQSKLTAAGLRTRIWYVTSGTAAGKVIGQSPAGGVRVKRGTTVLVPVSRGR
jgi:beta-lactam-binding protein with PASTA domain/acyl-CoA synthetase (AMP-forming)/AMP-acid ligase II